jgi:hypothetical protein
MEILAFRPKSIAMIETENSFVLEFLEISRPKVNTTLFILLKNGISTSHHFSLS